MRCRLSLRELLLLLAHFGDSLKDCKEISGDTGVEFLQTIYPQ